MGPESGVGVTEPSAATTESHVVGSGSLANTVTAADLLRRIQHLEEVLLLRNIPIPLDQPQGLEFNDTPDLNIGNYSTLHPGIGNGSNYAMADLESLAGNSVLEGGSAGFEDVLGEDSGFESTGPLGVSNMTQFQNDFMFLGGGPSVVEDDYSEV
jgi:hypothetical protein